MRLAISNLAWPSGADAAVAPIAIEAGASGVEVAPTKVWPAPLEATPAEVAAYRASWERRGLPIVALQALLFGRPDLTLFDGAPARRRTLDYLKGMISLAADLGAEALVFGSPRNRRRGSLTGGEADAIALPAFRELGDFAARNRVAFCIEPNPPAYDCDYVTSAGAGADLVDRVGSEGFALHLDAAGMTMAGDDPAPAFARAGAGAWRHFHVSEPYLAPVGRGEVDHRAFAAAARGAGYARWASIEMKEPPGPDWLDTVRAAVAFAGHHYLDRAEPDMPGRSAPSPRD